VIKVSTENKQSKSLLHHAVLRILSEKLSLIALVIVVIYFVVALLTSMGVLASNWGLEIGPSYGVPSSDSIKLFWA